MERFLSTFCNGLSLWRGLEKELKKTSITYIIQTFQFPLLFPVFCSPKHNEIVDIWLVVWHGCLHEWKLIFSLVSISITKIVNGRSSCSGGWGGGGCCLVKWNICQSIAAAEKSVALSPAGCIDRERDFVYTSYTNTLLLGAVQVEQTKRGTLNQRGKISPKVQRQ